MTHAKILTRWFGLQHRASLVANDSPALNGPWRWRQARAISDSATLLTLVDLLFEEEQQ